MNLRTPEHPRFYSLPLRDQIHGILTAAWEAGGNHPFDMSDIGLAWHLIQSGLVSAGSELRETRASVAEWRADR